MKIIVAIDGSKYTKKAVAYLSANREMLGEDQEVQLINVQTQLPAHVTRFLDAETVRSYYDSEARKALAPAEKLFKQQGIHFTSKIVTGHAAEEIVSYAKKQKARLIVMGTHGHGALGRALMGSVAQKVVADSDLPVLLIQ
jgi:nucleotide-binding universal stress UspA family protein